MRTFLVLLLVALGAVCYTSFGFTGHYGWLAGGVAVNAIQCIDLVFIHRGVRDDSR